MEELLKLINDFEQRNNISTRLELFSDGSGCICEFWEENERLEGFSNTDELINFLKNTRYKLDEEGSCISPVIRID